MNVFIASDHAGAKVKNYALNYLSSLKTKRFEFDIKDLSSSNKEGDDYPDFAKRVSKKVQKEGLGILVCGTGIGMSIAANKHKGIRAALCLSPQDAKLSREHNDANVLVLSGKTKKVDVVRIIDSFFKSNFAEGRHSRRINKIKRIEVEQNKL